MKMKQKNDERFGSQIQVLRGIELGVQPHILEQYRQLLRERSFDFIICSMHSTMVRTCIQVSCLRV